MKYPYQTNPVPSGQRKALNEKVLYLIDHGGLDSAGITPADIYNAYTGDGGLHDLRRDDYENYHEYSKAKKEIENGQFFTPPPICNLVVSCLKPSASDLIADLTCGMGNFFNFLPAESNAYGCEIDHKAHKVAHYLYPEANIELGDIRTYEPGIRFDYVIGNPPFNLKWYLEDGSEMLSQIYYCEKAAGLLKPFGIMAIIVPQSFLSDAFTNGRLIQMMESRFSFLGQVSLPENSFSAVGAVHFPTKLQFWQRRSGLEGWISSPYTTKTGFSLAAGFPIQSEANRIYKTFLEKARADLETHKSYVLLELAKSQNTSAEFQYKVKKLLYHIKIHPKLQSRYTKCYEYLYRFCTEKKPEEMSYEKWCKVKITEKKVISYLRKTLKKQNQPPEKDVITLVKQNYHFVYKGYSAKIRRQMTYDMRCPTPVYQAVLDNNPEHFPGYERLLRQKRKDYENQNQQFADMEEDPGIARWLSNFVLWDAENDEAIHLNDTQRHDINLVLQKRNTLLQWEQGSGKTLAGIAVGQYRMQRQALRNTWVVSSAISIRNNWDVVLKNYGISYVFVEKLKDLEQIRCGDFVIITLNKISQYQKQISKWMKQHRQKIQLVLDESDEISNSRSMRTKAVLACFRRCRMKLLTTGTSTRNNISEFAPQLELLYNNSVNMISWCSKLYCHKGKDSHLESWRNPNYRQPIPAYKKGYSLFSASHLPDKITVFGVAQRTQDIFNSEVLSELLGKTVITRTFEEVCGKDIKRLHQLPVWFPPEEKEVYEKAMDEFVVMRNHYFNLTGNSRKDSMMKLIQQIVLLLRISAAPDTVKEYGGDTPVKIMAAVELAAGWKNEIVAIGVRHKAVLDSYAEAIREYLPDRPLFIVTGSTTTFAKRRALRQTLRDSGNGILLCTQQSLSSSVNFEFVNKIIIPELHYNNSGMSQFYFRFIRYTSTEYKDVYFITYAGSIESNLMQMILVKEKLNLFMKGQDTNLDEIYERFDVDYDLLSLLMCREEDDKGRLRIRWGQQTIA